MSLRNRLVLPVILSSLAVLAGCGSSSSGTGIAPPSGGFANSNLSGTYVFSTTGIDPNGDLQVITGSFTADGKGGISGGFMDINNPAIGPVPAQAITGGSYNVGLDGRPANGSGLLNLTIAGPTTFSFDFVLSSSEGGLMTEFDAFGSGSGSLELQTTVTQSSINGQSYAFTFSGTSGVGTSICNFNTGFSVSLPFAMVGAFTVDSGGNMSGIEDVNSNCFSIYGTSGVAITGGSINLSTVPGTATITTAAANTYNFDVYPVTPTNLKFIETDALPVVSGEAFSQSSSVPTGNNVFALAGFDSIFGGPFTAAGLLVTDGAGNITSSSVQDINDSGSAGQVPVTGTYSTLSGGRSLLTLNGFVNGNGGTGCLNCEFAVYPSSGGLQILEVDNVGGIDGVAYLQGSSPTLASGEGYGMNLTGSNFNNGEEDDIAEFTNTSGNFSPGRIDYNNPQVGSLSWGNGFSGTYAADSTVSGRGTVTNGPGGYTFVTYAVNGGAGSPTAVVIDSDSNFVSVGSLAM